MNSLPATHVLPATGDRLAAFTALFEKGQKRGFVNEEEIDRKSVV